MTNEMPKSFAAEFDEVATDVTTDFHYTFEDISPELGRRLTMMQNSLFRTLAGNPHELLRAIASLHVAFFMAGREHALRGYASPIHRMSGDTQLSDLIPDDLSDL